MTGAAYYDNTSIITAEGKALRDGVQAAIAAGYKRWDLEGDNLIIIKEMQGTTVIPRQIQNVIEHIRSKLSQDVHVEIKHIY